MPNGGKPGSHHRFSILPATTGGDIPATECDVEQLKYKPEPAS